MATELGQPKVSHYYLSDLCFIQTLLVLPLPWPTVLLPLLP
jgi:hypothetical protein